MMLKAKFLKYLKHKRLYFTSRGNEAIKIALQYAKDMGCSKLFIQDQGRWMSYRKIAEKLGLEVVELETDSGLVKLPELQKTDDKCVLLYTNPTGYIADQDMKSIYDKCSGLGVMVVCDISGGFGEDYIDGDYADVFVCSFRKWKALSLGTGGFVSFKDKVELKIKEADLDFDKLSELFDKLPERLRKLHEHCEKIKKDLKEFNVVHPERKGIVVVVKFSNSEEKENIIKYCEGKDLEWTLCPREIRVNTDAISIEVKRRNY